MVLSIPGLKGRMGNTDFYQANMKAYQLVQAVRPANKLDEWTTMSIEEIIQREPDIKRVQEQIAPYIAETQERFWGAVIVLVYKGEIHFEGIENYLNQGIDLKHKGILSNIGIITINSNSLIMLDGLHRLLSLQKVMNFEVYGECSKEVPNDDISVIFIRYENNEKTRRIFNKVNRYAKTTSRNNNIITSEDDCCAIIARKLLSNDAPLGIKSGEKGNSDLIVEWKSHTLAPRSHKMTTISVVYETVKLILEYNKVSVDEQSRPNENLLDEYYQLVADFWQVVIDNLEPFKQAIKSPIKIKEMRDKEQKFSLLFKSVTQIALFRGLIFAINHGLNLDEAVQRANQVDWKISSDTWRNILVTPNGTITRAQQAINLGGKLISYLITADKMSQKEINEVEKEYKSAQGKEEIELPKPVAC